MGFLMYEFVFYIYQGYIHCIAFSSFIFLNLKNKQTNYLIYYYFQENTQK